MKKDIRIITDLSETSVKGGFENNKEQSPIFYYKDKELNDLYDKYVNYLIKERNYKYNKMDFSSILGKEEFEDIDSIRKRSENIISNIKQFVKTSYKSNENTLNIISTHHLNANMMVDFLINEMNNNLENNKIKKILNDKSFKYCNSYIFKYDKNNSFHILVS